MKETFSLPDFIARQNGRMGAKKWKEKQTATHMFYRKMKM